MQLTTRAIVLSSIKYGDTSLIVKAFTKSDGLKSYLLKGVLSSGKSRIKPAYFQPLTQLELVASHRNRGTLEHIREARISYPYTSLHTHTVKRAITLFLAEVLANSIHEEEKNEGLYHYLEAALQWLDTHDNVANFHILFLLELSKFLGFYPDTTARYEPYFDLAEGRFTRTKPLSTALSGNDLNNFRAFLGINFDGLDSIRMGHNNRSAMLQVLLAYFEIHLHGFRKPRSLAILNEVFS
jgi:DNA repair protein RecO (recombination protein O)